MCVDAEVEGNFTNHSLRATGATTLFDAGVPESLIQKRTGHRSLDALRMYERVTPQQEKAVSDVLASTTELSYFSAKERESASYRAQNNDTFFLDTLPPCAFQWISLGHCITPEVIVSIFSVHFNGSHNFRQDSFSVTLKLIF